MTRAPQRTIAVVMGLSLLTNACFAYRPATEATVMKPATPVRVHLARPVDFRLTNLQATDVVTVQGEVIRVDGDSVLVSAKWLRARSGYEFVGAGETVGVPRSEVAGIEAQRLAPGRTALLVAGVVTAMSAIAAATGLYGGDDDSGGGDPATQ